MLLYVTVEAKVTCLLYMKQGTDQGCILDELSSADPPAICFSIRASRFDKQTRIVIGILSKLYLPIRKTGDKIGHGSE
jgi:hypothetical protein